jgi:hypothetical protein
VRLSMVVLVSWPRLHVSRLCSPHAG